jgi:hypothetical protein
MVEGAFSLQIGGAFKYEKKPWGALHVVILFYFILFFVFYCRNTGEHPHTDSDRIFELQTLLYEIVKTVASKHTCGKTLAKKTVQFHRLLLRKSEVFAKNLRQCGHFAIWQIFAKKSDDRDEERPLLICPIWQAHLWCIHT